MGKRVVGRKFELNRNDLCVCGSGKKYKRCCIEHNYEFWSIGQNYKNEEIIYNKAEEERKEKLFIEYISSVRNKVNSMNKEDSIEVLKKIYEELGMYMSEISRFFACQKGCSQCCSMYVESTALEAENIRRYVDQMFTESEKEAFLEKVQSRKFIAVDRDSRDSYFRRNLPCVFLNGNKECSIYEVRPFSCRKFAVFSHPSNCYPDSTSAAIFNSTVLNDIEILLGLMNISIYDIPEENASSMIKHLPKWFENDFKPIEV